MHSANAALEDYLRAGELGCHPDLELRLRELGESEPDPEFAIPVLTRDVEQQHEDRRADGNERPPFALHRSSVM